MRIVTAGVLAGAYRGGEGRPRSGAAMLTHAVELDEQGRPARVLCGRVEIDHLADDLAGTPRELEPPSCPRCLAKWKKR